MRLLQWLLVTIGSCHAMVNFSNSTLIDRYDVNRYQLPIPKCNAGCVIYAATLEAAPPNTGTEKRPPFASNLFFYDNARSTSLASVVDIAKIADGSKNKIPFVINGPADISIVNRNQNYNVVDAYSFVIYIVEKSIADSISSEVYDVQYPGAKTVNPKSEIVTLLSTEPYKLIVHSRTEADKITVRLAGFDNARDNNKDECDIAYTTEGSEFDGFTLLPNTAILSLATNSRTEATLKLESQWKPNMVNRIGPQIDFEAALNAARQMFADGASGCSYRPNAKQIVYFLTSSVPSANVKGADEFKTGGGIIMVNGFNVDGACRPGFVKFASPNFFFTDLTENYLDNLGVFCEANCFCDPSKQSFNDDANSPRTLANRGCFTPFNQGIPQQKARENCIKSGGALVSIHDDKKDAFVSKVASSVAPNKKYWLGLQNDGKAWNWDDKSSDPYTNWDANQPKTNGGKLKCAYVAQAGQSVKWTTANCMMGGVIHVCESAPCSRGNKNC